jgi:LCP family protein required for cell wall assembly
MSALTIPRAAMDEEQPQYTLYRTRPKLFGRRDDVQSLAPDTPPPDAPPKRPWRRLRPRRILALLALALVGWVLVSLVLFLISSQIESSKVDSAAKGELTGAGFTMTSPNTILVLGSDARPKGTHEAGAQTIGQPSRSDSILLMRIGGGKNATLSIPRDTVVNIPGHGMDKINAAYAYGGPALAIRTVEQFTGLQINHLVEVNFDNFPQLVDALGGITYKGGCVVSKLNGGFKNGGYTLRLPAGTHHINGKQALALARTRHNACNARDSDLTRARRQQKILAGIKDKVTSVSTFVRLPWVSWAAPKAVRSDMAGPSLLGLVGAELTAGSKSPAVLKPSGVTTTSGGGAGLTVDPATVRAAVAKFLRG